jgi:hypothetical protein
MKTVSRGAMSGCLVWLVVFGLLSACLCPLAMLAAGITSATNAEFVAQALGPALCPPETTPHIASYATTIHEDGADKPATGYELRCLDAAGLVAANRGGSYALLWSGLLGAGGLALAALLALLLAAPAGALFARLTKR